jgi:hypothetical protein
LLFHDRVNTLWQQCDHGGVPEDVFARRKPHHPAETLAGRVEALRANLAQSGSLIEEINAELHLQTTALDRIRAEAEQNQRLAALHKVEADAVRDLVAATIEGAQARAAHPSRRQQWLFFLAGLFFSVPLGVVGNFVYAMLTR